MTTQAHGMTPEQRKHWIREISRAVGDQIGFAREHARPTRRHAATLIPGTERTVISWELGTRALTIPRQVEVCQAIGADPAVVLTKALVTVGDITGFTLLVNLIAIAADRTKGFEKAQSWARHRSSRYPNDTEVLLSARAVRELAVAFNCPHLDLAHYLYEFSDRNTDGWTTENPPGARAGDAEE